MIIYLSASVNVWAWADPNRPGFVENVDDDKQPSSALMVRIATCDTPEEPWQLKSSVMMPYEQLLELASDGLVFNWRVYRVQPSECLKNR